MYNNIVYVHIENKNDYVFRTRGARKGLYLNYA